MIHQNWPLLHQMMPMSYTLMSRNSISILFSACLFLASCTIAGIGRQKESDRIAGTLQLEFRFEDNTMFNATVDLRSGLWSGEARDQYRSGRSWMGGGTCEYSLKNRKLVLFLNGEHEPFIKYGFGKVTISVYGEFSERKESQLIGPLTGTAFIDKIRWEDYIPVRIRGKITSFVTTPLEVLSIFSPQHESNDPRINWLRDHSIRVRSVSPEDEDFSDLQALKTVIGDSRIVMLGEQSHGDGTTFLAKTRLIKFLHQEMGFDVLAMESGLYDCSKAWEFLVEGEDPYTAVRRGVFPIWTDSEQFQPLIDYLGEQANSQSPLELTGFDCQFTGIASIEFLVTELEDFLNRNDLLSTNDSNWHRFSSILSRLIHREFYDSPPPGEDEQLHFYEVLGILESEVDRLSQQNTQDRGQLWAQLFRSTEVHAKSVWTSSQDTPSSQDTNLRDLQMGRNLIWLSKSRFANRKIIVWAATSHIVKNISLLGHRPMGDVVWQALGDQVYILGFTALEGQAGAFHRTPFDISPPDIGSIEYLMGRAGLEYAIVDFRNPPTGGEWLQEEMVCRALGYSPIPALWANSMDGIMFTRLMIPSTRTKR